MLTAASCSTGIVAVLSKRQPIMSGFHRIAQPPALDRAGVTAFVTRFVSELSCRAVEARQDPFRIDNPCLFNRSGDHELIVSCGDIVCRHCSRVFWQ